MGDIKVIFEENVKIKSKFMQCHEDLVKKVLKMIRHFSFMRKIHIGHHQVIGGKLIPRRSHFYKRIFLFHNFNLSFSLFFSLSFFFCRNHFQTKVPNMLGLVIKTMRVIRMPKRRKIVASPAVRRLDLQVRGKTLIKF